MINELKEKICEVAEDYDSQMKRCMDSRTQEVHKLQDGNEISISGEKYQCPEMLFQQTLALKDHYGLHEQTFKSIQKLMRILKKICSKM